VATRQADPDSARRLGRARLIDVTVGVAAASLVGVGVVAAYDAQHYRQGSPATASQQTVSSGDAQSRSADGDVHGDEDGEQRGLQAPASPPVVTRQPPQAVSGGS
jgi:hypothetical protein